MLTHHYIMKLQMIVLSKQSAIRVENYMTAVSDLSSETKGMKMYDGINKPC